MTSGSILKSVRILAHVLPYVKANSSIRAAGVGGMASRYLKHFDEQLLFLFLFLFFGGGGNLMLLLFVSREKSKDLLDWCYCLFFSFFSFEEARLQVPIARHPCSVISISYDQKKKKDEKKDHSTE